MCVYVRADCVESMDTAKPLPASSDDDGTMKAATADAAVQSSCPALTNETQDVHQFVTSHAINGGVVNLLLAYLTELSQRCHLTW